MKINWKSGGRNESSHLYENTVITFIVYVMFIISVLVCKVVNLASMPAAIAVAAAIRT
jgi:hypothetical protein